MHDCSHVRKAFRNAELGGSRPPGGPLRCVPRLADGSEVDETDTQRTQVDVDLRAFAFLFVPCGVDDTQLPPSAPSHGTMVISSYYYNTKDLPEFYAHRSTHRQDPIAPSPTSQIESQKKVITSNSLWACSAVHAGGSGILRACAASNGPGLPQMPGRDGTTKM